MIQNIIYTSIEQDGMMSGPNLHALKDFISKTEKPVIASGGVHTHQDIDHLRDLSNDGIAGCIIGKALLSGHLSMDVLSI